MTDLPACPCGSNLAFDDCCGPLLDGKKKADSPEALMRSRYSAYVRQDMPYLASTLHPSQRADYDEEGATRWAKHAEWDHLEIVSSDLEPGNSNRGHVEFKVFYSMDGDKLAHHERSEFRRTKDTWYFYDGRMVASGQYRRETPKVGRNDPCPCGSGKKYKKCCG